MGSSVPLGRILFSISEFRIKYTDPTNSSVVGKDDLKKYNKGLATGYTDLHGLICVNPCNP